MRIVGLGNALTDVLARLHSDECFDEMGLLKGGMQLIDEEKLLRIMSVFEGLETTLASGGSAANAVSGVARMGIESGFIGENRSGCLWPLLPGGYGAQWRADFVDRRRTGFGLCHDDDNSRWRADFRYILGCSGYFVRRGALCRNVRRV